LHDVYHACRPSGGSYHDQYSSVLVNIKRAPADINPVVCSEFESGFLNHRNIAVQANSGAIQRLAIAIVEPRAVAGPAGLVTILCNQNGWFRRRIGTDI
jgi:hypothetical protein